MIIQRPSPNISVGRHGWTPDLIVCHITEGGFDGTVSWITNRASQVSYHFVVARDGRIVQAVDIENTAWANGTTNNGDNRDNRHSTIDIVRERRVNANLYSISIGFEGRFTEKQGDLTSLQMNAAVGLIKDIQNEIKRIYNFDMFVTRSNLVGHSEITPRTRPNCPGRAFPFDIILRQLNLVEKSPQLASEQCVAEWATDAWKWAFNIGLTDGTRPQDQMTRQEVVTLLHRFYNFHRIRHII